ncbi:hypothetical protein RclHR1_31600002 [Rhizophagus clarus]|uniref:Uncharacterized protein n=1 Tax=Rhizophagus clarus TaxID=94130 RepID=A0A2Z6R7L6_9GLOM|nr:hypothetical protein RclHR1_31600002 [Rhizophagus clarus]
MHTSTISDQTDRTGTSPVLRYDSTSLGKYLSDSDSYNDNDSDCGSDDYNNYESNYESDNEEASCALTSTTKAVKERKVNVTYTLRQENFNDKFSPKDLLNAIQGILSSPPRDMSDDKGLLDCLPIYSFLFLNEKGSSLYNAYDQSEVKDKLVIKIDQDADHAPKFSVADDISEVHDLPGIHECINGQKPLRAVIDIDASKEDMETASIKGQEVFIRICCFFIRALYQILDCSWEDILKGLIVTTSTDPSKCSYHILYALALLIDHHELKAFTELVYTITGEKFGKYIDRGLPGQNFNLRLIGSAKKGCVKRILQFSLENGWNELDHARVQPPTSLGLKVRPRMLSTGKNNNLLRISVGQDVLQKCADLVLQKHSNYLRDWTIEEKDSENFVYFNRKAPLECPLCKRIHDKDQHDEPGEVFECDPSIAEKIQQENKNSPQISHRVKGPSFPKAFIKFPSWAKKDVQGIVHALRTDFPELRIKEYHGKSDPMEKAQDFSNVEESWSDVNLVAYTSTLKIGVSCTNPKFERAFCIFNCYIETNAGTNQMLFCMQCIKDYICHIEQRFSNVPVTENGLFQWLLNAKRECLPLELQNRGIFPVMDSIIWNKDVPTVCLWVAYMLKSFCSWHLFGWSIRKFYRAKNCIYVILWSKYYASFQYRKIYAILRSK